jgi:peptidyl-tRNA hydrolase
MSTSDYVLGKWSETEQSNIYNIVKISSEIVFSFIQTGIEQTMNFYNKKNFIDEDL